MAEITTRRQGEMLKTLFRILAEEPDGLQAKEAIARVESAMHLTPFERDTFPRNPELVRFPKILRFSTINAVKAGWLHKKSGIWSLTDDGRTAATQYRDPEALFVEARRLYREWASNRPQKTASDESAEGDVLTGDAGLLAATTLEEAEDGARRVIQEFLAEINPYDFQDLVAALIEAMGYHVLWTAPKGRDGGIDLVAQQDPLGVEGPRIKGQVKRRGQKTTEEELRSFLSLIENGDVGVYISLAGFTRDAEELSRRASRRVTLIDGDALLNLWIENYKNIKQDGRQLLPIRPVWFLDLDG